MDSYRQLQAERWKRNHPRVEDSAISDHPRVEENPVRLIKEVTSPTSEISIVAVDSTSMESVRKFSETTPCTGILFGTIGEDGFSVIVDTIYETPWDSEHLHDSRLPMVLRVSGLMGLRPVGIFISQLTAPRDYIRVANLEHAISHVILTMNEAVILTRQCIQHVKEGRLTPTTTLEGRTVKGGLDGKELWRSAALVSRSVNTVVHTGFYRLNRWNHIPTFDDARAFILARRQAKILQLHVQLADYHLILFIADTLGESSAERVILAIYQEEDALLEDLVELLMTSSEEL